MGLPSNSQNVPQDVWNNISNLSHMVCPKFNSHVYKQKKVGHRGTCMGAKRFSSWGMSNVPKKSTMGQSIWLLQKKKSCEHTHELINMNPDALSSYGVKPT
jgi:hypothetical protein